jgi:hypothetical protein
MTRETIAEAAQAISLALAATHESETGGDNPADPVCGGDPVPAPGER